MLTALQCDIKGHSGALLQPVILLHDTKIFLKKIVFFIFEVLIPAIEPFQRFWFSTSKVQRKPISIWVCVGSPLVSQKLRPATCFLACAVRRFAGGKRKMERNISTSIQPCEPVESVFLQDLTCSRRRKHATCGASSCAGTHAACGASIWFRWNILSPDTPAASCAWTCLHVVPHAVSAGTIISVGNTFPMMQIFSLQRVSGCRGTHLQGWWGGARLQVSPRRQRDVTEPVTPPSCGSATVARAKVFPRCCHGNLQHNTSELKSFVIFCRSESVLQRFPGEQNKILSRAAKNVQKNKNKRCCVLS